MIQNINIEECRNEYFQQNHIDEYPVFCIARQGGRTAMEILTRALIMEGKYAYLGQNLTGLRSMGTNSFVLRVSDNPNIPPGFNLNAPKGLMLMHEALVSLKKGMLDFMTQLSSSDAIKQFKTGLLMVNTPKSPEDLVYPVSFKGTVATVDAEKIFSEIISIRPAPSGITSLGLFAAATEDLVDIETLKKAVMLHDRLDKKTRETNIICLEEAYKQTKVIHDIKFEVTEDQEASNELNIDNRGVSTKWRKRVPVCDTANCNCAECLSAYYCPEAAINWKDNHMHIDYDVCKSCGTCALVCVRDAITIEDTEKVAAEK